MKSTLRSVAVFALIIFVFVVAGLAVWPNPVSATSVVLRALGVIGKVSVATGSARNLHGLAVPAAACCRRVVLRLTSPRRRCRRFAWWAFGNTF